MFKEYKGYEYMLINGYYHIRFTNIDEQGNLDIEGYDKITEEEIKKIIDRRIMRRKNDLERQL